jgi:hypothetical protein
VDVTNINRIILRTGHFIDLSPQGRDGEKTFLNSVPICTDQNGPSVRTWYHNFSIHCASAGIYAHPYYLFENSTSPRGFTIGDDEDDDLPSNFQSSIERMDSLVHTALTKCFKNDRYSKTKDHYNSVQQNHGHGYQALVQILMNNHPSVIERPSILCRDRPRQDEETIQTYYRNYNNFLELRAYAENNQNTLNDIGEVNAFIDGLKYSDYLHSVSRMDRKDPTKNHKFTPGTLITTLTAYLAYDESPAKKRAPYVGQTPYVPNNKRWTSRPQDKNVEEIDQLNVDINQIIHDNLDEEFYEAVINQVEKKPHLAHKRPCLVCSAFSKGTNGNIDDHIFKDCPILNNHSLLQDIHIAFCSGQKRMSSIQQEALAKINQICVECSDDDADDKHEKSDFQKD